MRFANKVALVTGGASGIGRAVCAQLAEEGGRVAILDMWEEGGNKLAGDLQQASKERAIFVKCDVSREREVEAAVAEAVKAFGKIDMLFNLAGGSMIPGPRSGPQPPWKPVWAIDPDRTIDHLTEEAWDITIDSHLKGTFLCSKHVVRQMKKQGTGGAIVNTASWAGLVAMPNGHAYVAAKHGIVGLTKVMALELVDAGIRVNAVAPAATDTNMLRAGKSALPPEQLADIKSRHPMGRPAHPEEIAKGMLFLTSEDASYINGITLPVDGAYTAR